MSGTNWWRSAEVEVDDQVGEGPEALAEETGVLLWRKDGAGGIRAPALKGLSWEEEAPRFYGAQGADG